MYLLSKESIAIIAFFLGAVLAGSFVYIHERFVMLEQFRMIAQTNIANIPACVPKTAEGTLNEQAALSRVISWGETMAERTDAAVSLAMTQAHARFLEEDARRLRMDAKDARAAYERIVGVPYDPSAVDPSFALPSENSYLLNDPNFLPQILIGNLMFAKREVYAPLLFSSDPLVRAIGERYEAYVEKVITDVNTQVSP